MPPSSAPLREPNHGASWIPPWAYEVVEEGEQTAYPVSCPVGLEVATMSIPLSCSCGRAMRVKGMCAGKRVRCPACKAIVAVPASVGQQQVQARPGSARSTQVPVALGISAPPRRPIPGKLPSWVVAAAVASMLPLAAMMLAVFTPRSPARADAAPQPSAAVTTDRAVAAAPATQPDRRSKPVAPPSQGKKPDPAPQTPPTAKAEKKNPEPPEPAKP
jgi:hypothetical protein